MNTGRVAYISEGVEALAVSANTDADVEIQRFERVDGGLETEIDLDHGVGDECFLLVEICYLNAIASANSSTSASVNAARSPVSSTLSAP